MINENFVYLGLLIIFLGEVSYLIKTIRGKVQPNRTTWFLWTLAPLIVFVAQIKQGVGLQAFLAFITGFVPLLTLLATFYNKKAYWKTTRLDLLYGFLSIFGLFLWLITGVGNLAIILNIFADLMGSIPTVLKSFKKPESESAFAYGIIGAGSLITVLTIHEWNFQTYGFPIYIFLICSLLFVLIQFKIGKRFIR